MLNAQKYVTHHLPNTLKHVDNVVMAEQMFLEKGYSDDELRMHDMVMRELIDEPLPENWDNVVSLR